MNTPRQSSSGHTFSAPVGTAELVHGLPGDPGQRVRRADGWVPPQPVVRGEPRWLVVPGEEDGQFRGGAWGWGLLGTDVAAAIFVDNPARAFAANWRG